MYLCECAALGCGWLLCGAWAWLRSVNYNNSNNFLIINTDGTINNNNANNSGAVAPGFRNAGSQTVAER